MHNFKHALGAGQTLPISESAHAVASAGRVERHEIADGCDCEALDAESKAEATMTVRAARACSTLHDLAGRGFLRCLWGMSKEPLCLRAARDLLVRFGSAA
jgi:hypothetical protein